MTASTVQIAPQLLGPTLSNVATQTVNSRVYQEMVSGLVNVPYDYISLSYTGANITGIVYYVGGSGGVVVATLTLGYSGVNLVSIART